MQSQRSYCSIGKANLIQAVGTMATYSAGIRKVYVRSNEMCKGCPHYNSEPGSHCFSCSNSSNTPVDKTIRVNESNIYGKKERLNLNCLKTLFYLHYADNIDACGLVSGVSLDGIAKELGITVRTVRAVLEDLRQKKYIAYSPTFEGKRDIFILNYKDYFKKADQGGRGYIVFNQSAFHTLNSIKDINMARIFLRGYIAVDSNNDKDGLYDGCVERNIADIRRELPGYVRSKTVKRIVEGFESITNFTASVNKDVKGAVTIHMDESLFGKKTRKETTERNEKDLAKFLENINDLIHYYRLDTANTELGMYSYLSTLEKPRPVNKDLFKIHDLACLSDWHSMTKVKGAILKVVAIMNRKGYEDDPILNVPGYIRTILEKKYNEIERYEIMA